MSTEIDLILDRAKVDADLIAVKDMNDQVDGKIIKTKAEGEGKIAELEARTDALDAKVKERVQTLYGMLTEAELEGMRSVQRALGFVRQIYSLIKQALSAAGVSLPPILSALISTAFTVAATLLSIGQANLSNPYTAALGIMTIAGSLISLGAAIDAETKSASIQAQLDAAQNVGPSLGMTGYEAVII